MEAGAGDPGTANVARSDVAGPDWTDPRFDLPGTGGPSGVAGRRVEIRQNPFRSTLAVDGRSGNRGAVPSVHVRGTAREGVRDEHDCLPPEQGGSYRRSDGSYEVTFSNDHHGRYALESKDVGAAHTSEGPLQGHSAVERRLSRERRSASALTSSPAASSQLSSEK